MASSSEAPKKVWASLLTNPDYLPGLLTLHHSLIRTHTAYPLIALTIDTLDQNTLSALHTRGIKTHTVPRLVPSRERDYAGDPRFYDTWTKLTAFSLTQYERLVLLDSDMLVRRNMDELMDLELDPPLTDAKSLKTKTGVDGEGSPSRVFAAGCACTCNPMKRPAYPETWKPENCPFTSQHDLSPSVAASTPPNPAPLYRLNSGLLVIVPSTPLYEAILARMDCDDTAEMRFPDQDLLADMFSGRWAPLPYVYNALKTLRWENVHGVMWRDGEVKNIHYILGPKPWDEVDEQGKWTGTEESHKWWADANNERKEDEKSRGITDGH